MGKSECVFDPAETIAKEDFIILMAKGLQLDTSLSPDTPTFSDIGPGHYAFLYVEAAVQAGIVATGQTDGAFGVGQPLSRWELVGWLERMDELVGIRLLPSDREPLAEAFGFVSREAVSDSYWQWLSSGKKVGTFRTSEHVDRQELAGVLAMMTAKMGQTDTAEVLEDVEAAGGQPIQDTSAQASPGAGIGKSAITAKHTLIMSRPLPDLEMNVGDEPVHLSLTDVFADETDDRLHYAASSCGTGKLAIRQQGDSLWLTALAEGTAAVRVVARSGRGGLAVIVFQVAIGADQQTALPSSLINPFSTQILAVGEPPVVIDASGVFAEEESDVLSYVASSSNPAFLQASARDAQIVLVPLAAGKATVRVTARDAGGAEITVTFLVKIKEEPATDNHSLSAKHVVAVHEMSLHDPPVAAIRTAASRNMAGGSKERREAGNPA